MGTIGWDPRHNVCVPQCVTKKRIRAPQYLDDRVSGTQMAQMAVKPGGG